MGILDDAIREHLELKRKHGASGDDLERLEKEAFGPPARPGEAEEGTGEEPTGRGAALLDPETGEQAERLEVPFGPEDEGDWDEGPAESGESAALAEADGPGSAEQGRVEHAYLDDTVDHPVVGPPETGEQPLAEEESEEPYAEEAEGGPFAARDDAEGPLATEQPEEPLEAAIFDQDEADDEEDLSDLGDLDLDLEDEPTEAAPAAEGGGEGFEPDAPAEDELEDEDEDLLEETPDFLQDTPEGERLWFEQGEPKDFDFDED